jgi:hypothetical protein
MAGLVAVRKRAAFWVDWAICSMVMAGKLGRKWEVEVRKKNSD